MKRCPTCNREFDDDSLSVCIDDGSPLIKHIPGTPKMEFPTTQSYTGMGGKATWSASREDVPKLRQFLSAKEEPQRKSWAWVIAIVAVLFMIILAIVMVVFRNR